MVCSFIYFTVSYSLYIAGTIIIIFIYFFYLSIYFESYMFHLKCTSRSCRSAGICKDLFTYVYSFSYVYATRTNTNLSSFHSFRSDTWKILFSVNTWKDRKVVARAWPGNGTRASPPKGILQVFEQKDVLRVFAPKEIFLAFEPKDILQLLNK